jgi:hypothetical protein
VIETSLSCSAQESPELIECPRHVGEECPRCDGNGYRLRRYCAGCGAPSGSVSQETGLPLVRDRLTDGQWYHVTCRPGARGKDALLADLQRMGG